MEDTYVLYQSFKDWHRKKLDEYFPKYEETLFRPKYDPEVWKALQMTEEEFLERFINPYKGLKISQIKKISELQTLSSHYSLGKLIDFTAATPTNRFLNALDWTFVQIVDLNIPSFNPTNWTASDINETDFTEEEEEELLEYWQGWYLQPYKQCFWCGLPNFDKRDKEFEEEQKFCHLENCASSPNPKDHEDECCFREWKSLKKNYNQHLKRNKNNAENILIYFEKFCETRFLENQEIDFSIQTRRHEAKSILP